MNGFVDKRTKISEELIKTESTYLKHLNLILKFFVDPILCSGLLSLKDITTLFGDIRSIRLVNQVLYDQLNNFGICFAFSQLVHFLKLYSGYARNFSSSQMLLTRLIRINKEFRRFIEQQENLPDLNGLKLPALLITPIQRIPRYKLLLEQLIAETDEETEDKSNLKCILSQLKEVADRINNCVDDFDNCSQIIAIQRSLDDCAPKLMIPGRRLLKSGKLTKIRCKNENILLYTREYAVLDDWVTALQSAIKNLIECRRTLRKESSSSNPLRRGVLKNYRQHSSLTEKFRRQQNEVVQLRKENNIQDQFSNRVRKRVLNFLRKRPNPVEPDTETCSTRAKNRRMVGRSPILSVVEEEELKRISLSESQNERMTYCEKPETPKRRPWWLDEQEAASSRKESDKKFWCCTL